jgi:hypothetical protein
MLLFKYLSPEAIAKVFERPAEVAIRFGLPASFNDPYELFLQPNPALTSDEEFAFYEYFLGEIPQLPVTCFSRIPYSIAMWAHYGDEQSGICLGFDEDVLTDQFPFVYIDDVSYSDEPAQVQSYLVQYALATGKRRHTEALLATGNRAAYFVKRREWQYECERRLIVGPDDVEEHGPFTIGRLSSRVLRYIIIGKNCNDVNRRLCGEWSAATGIPILEFRVGKRSYEPFFLYCGKGLAWRDPAFVETPTICSTCGDPTDGRCRWCGISEETRISAPKRSMLTAMLQYKIIDAVNIEFRGLEPRGYRRKRNALEPSLEGVSPASGDLGGF